MTITAEILSVLPCQLSHSTWQILLNSLRTTVDGSVEEESGAFEFSFTGNISAESKLIWIQLILGLRNIAETYGEQYIKIRFEEV